MELETTKRILAALEREGVRYVIFGAVALNLLGLARATVPVSVASPMTLYRMKKDTVRPKDWSDAEALRRRFRLEGD